MGGEKFIDARGYQISDLGPVRVFLSVCVIGKLGEGKYDDNGRNLSFSYRSRFFFP
jgi:hypothetical protein